MIQQVIIIGGHIQALGLARQAHRVGVCTILYLTESYSVARYSNSIDKVIRGSFAQIIQDIKRYEGYDTMLFPTNDEAIGFLSEHYDALSRHYTLGIPSPTTVQLFYNKRNTAAFAVENDIPCPKTICPHSIDDIAVVSSSLHYPVVLKPAVMFSFHKLFGKKAFLCSSSSELEDTARKISEHYPIDQMIVQEYLSGGPRYLYSYGVFAYQGEPRAWIMANRIRQNPMDFGNSTTFAITSHVPVIEEISRKILSITNYSGLAEIEFMYNSKTQRYEMLEVNTRAWKWHALSETHDFGFFSELLLFYNDKSSCFKPCFAKTAWVESLTDSAICIKEIIHGRIKASEILSSYRIKKKHAVWSFRDPLPAIMYLILSPFLFFSRR